jgi:hypothetical protein
LRRKRQLSLAQRRKLLLVLPEIVEGPPGPGFDTGDQWTVLQCTHRRVFLKFDYLPIGVRRALQENTVTFDPVPIADYMRTHPKQIGFVIEAIREEERLDMLVFARVEEGKFGYPYPHLAAGASILRYFSAGGVKRGRTQKAA